MKPSPEASIDGLISRLAAAGPGYREKVERTLKRVQAILSGPKVFRWMAGDPKEATAGERALRLELALLDGLKAGTLRRIDLPDGSKKWAMSDDTVKRWFTEKEIA